MRRKKGFGEKRKIEETPNVVHREREFAVRVSPVVIFPHRERSPCIKEPRTIMTRATLREGVTWM